MDSLDKELNPELDYFMSEDKSDVVFVIDGQRVPALKIVMSMKSKVFEAMFSEKFKECEESVIEIKDTTYDAFKAMVCFVYTDQFIVEDYNDYKLVSNVCKLADRYQMSRLFVRIDKHYKTLISMENFEQLSGIGFHYKIQSMMSSLKEFMAKNFTEFKSKSFEDMKRINDLTDNSLFELMANNYLKTERYFKPLTIGPNGGCIIINGLQYYFNDTVGQRLFNFDSMDKNDY